MCLLRVRMQDPPPPPLLAPAAALLRRLAPYGLQVPDAWLQPRIVLLDVGARPSEPGRILRPLPYRAFCCLAAVLGRVWRNNPLGGAHGMKVYSPWPDHGIFRVLTYGLNLKVKPKRGMATHLSQEEYKFKSVQQESGAC